MSFEVDSPKNHGPEEGDILCNPRGGRAYQPNLVFTKKLHVHARAEGNASEAKSGFLSMNHLLFLRFISVHSEPVVYNII